MNPNSPGGNPAAPDPFKPPEYAVRFYCKTDPWRQFRGYVFEQGKTTTIKDRATIEALDRHPDFERYAEPVNGVRRHTLSLPKRRGRPAKTEVVL